MKSEVNNMGHAVEMLTFPAEMNRNRIQAECDEWGSANCDPRERGGYHGGLGSKIDFKDRLFDNYDAAYEYLESTIGNYRQIAVKYLVYPPMKPSKTAEDLDRRITEYRKRINALDAPHYKGVKQATVKCKCCGSSLATKFCGDTYRNNCSVCRADLRPQSTLDKIANYKATVKDLEKKLKAEVDKQNMKNRKSAKVHWMVCCEVHC